MATLKVTEYAAALRAPGGGIVPVGEEPQTQTQAITYTTATTVTLLANTQLIRLKSSAKAHIEWDGTAATAANMDLEADTPEYFGVVQDGTAKTFSVYDGTS